MKNHGVAGRPAALHQDLIKLYRISIVHRKVHGCGGYSFEEAGGQLEWVSTHKPRRVVELGTALGYTAAIFAPASPGCHVDTVASGSLYVSLARENLAQLGLANRTTVHCGDFEPILAGLTQEYDLIFL